MGEEEAGEEAVLSMNSCPKCAAPADGLRFCGQYGTLIESAPSVPAPAKGVSWGKGCLIATGAAVLLLVLLIAIISSGTDNTSAPQGISREGNEYSNIIARFGQPDRNDSTEYDSPRPPIPTRIIEYRAEKVKVIFFPPNAKMGEQPPYDTWKVMGFIDMNTNTAISRTEAMDRLKGRR